MTRRGRSISHLPSLESEQKGFIENLRVYQYNRRANIRQLPDDK